MQIIDILNFQEFYSSIADMKMPLQISYKIAKILKNFEDDYKFYQNNFEKIITEYAELDENGNFKYLNNGNSIKINPDKLQQCAKAIEELQNIQIEDSSLRLTLDELNSLEDIDLTPNQLGKILSFIQ